MHNIVITEQSKTRFYKEKIGQGWVWAYMGKDIPKRERIAAVLKDDNRYLYSDELKEASCLYKQSFLDWVGEMGKEYSGSILWWAARFASKSTFQTDFYLLFCCIRLLKKWSTQRNKRLIIFVEDAFLFEAARENLKSSEIFFNASRYFYLKQYLSLAMRTFLVPVYFFFKYVTYYLINRVFKKIYKRDILPKVDILIHTWVEKRSFKDNIFRDFYFRDLYSTYEECGYKTLTLTKFKLDISLLRKAYHFNNIIPLSCFTPFRAIFDVLFTHLTLFKTDQPLLGGLNLKALLKRERLNDTASPAMRVYLLEYYTYKRFCAYMKENGIKLFVYPFENQPWEKLMLSAFKEEKAPFKTTGYQHSSIPELLFSYDLGKGEAAYIPLPDTILANSSYNETRLKKAGFPRVYNGGALRYKRREFKNIASEDNTLLLCTVSVEYSLALILYGMKILPGDQKNFLIKLHPDIHQKKIRRHLRDLPIKARFIEGDLDDLHSRFDTVIHTGATARLDCIAMGKKVYKLKTELLDIDPLDNLIKQNSLDEKTNLHMCRYEGYPVDINLFYEDFKRPAWLKILN